MPLVRISLRAGKPPEHIRAITDGLYAAMREAFAVPEDDRFMLVSQHRDEEFVYDASYLGIARSARDCGRRMCSSAWSRCRRRIGRSATDWRNTPDHRFCRVELARLLFFTSAIL